MDQEVDNYENINNDNVPKNMSTYSKINETTTQEVYFRTTRTLNSKQKALYDHCMKAATSSERMLIFITGGAGVGKSVLMRDLHEGFTRYYARLRGSTPDRIKVLRMAPTGSAAFNIGGETINRGLKVPINTKCVTLCTEKLIQYNDSRIWRCSNKFTI